MSNPRIYVACLASYNNGVLHGRWIDLDGMDAEDVQAGIAAMLRESPHPNITVECPACGGSGDAAPDRPAGVPPLCAICNGTCKVPSAEEWAVHDSEDLPTGFRDTEWPDLSALLERLEEMDELHDSEREAFEAFQAVELTDATVTRFRDCYIGEFESWADLAEEHVESAGLLQEAPEELARYFDYERYGTDMRLGGAVFEHCGHFFWAT
ncbi:antirestriction protein ArdA [Xanthomonas campestris]|uniref:antirestriction protein ArdA n=1 Tax=Xanthomonas campestris TaxID=339 RepID=UPI0005AF1486|nr:antirestriction protein ArdA [Xanthomonas campestris]KIQ27503.1 antirestriction protein [Xanthomonas campestris]